MGYFKFSDGASVAFKGSWNETPSGAITGLEDCDVYTSDRDNDKDSNEQQPDRETRLEMPRMAPPLVDTVPTAMAIEPRNLKIDINPMYRVEEGVVTPNGTTIRRRRIEV